MNKKDFYEAPKWGLRTVRVERSYLNSISNTTDSWDDPATDGTSWGSNDDNNGME